MPVTFFLFLRIMGVDGGQKTEDIRRRTKDKASRPKSHVLSLKSHVNNL